MKKIIIICLLLCLSAVSYSQANKRETEFNKDYYLKKRSQNNTLAHSMLWGGLGVATAGLVISSANGPSGKIVFFNGIGSMVASIPFFYFAANNRKKASSLSLKKETVPRLFNQNLVYSTIPSVSLKISL